MKKHPIEPIDSSSWPTNNSTHFSVAMLVVWVSAFFLDCFGEQTSDLLCWEGELKAIKMKVLGTKCPSLRCYARKCWLLWSKGFSSGKSNNPLIWRQKMSSSSLESLELLSSFVVFVRPKASIQIWKQSGALYTNCLLPKDAKYYAKNWIFRQTDTTQKTKRIWSTV